MQLHVVETPSGLPVVRLAGDMRLWGKQGAADQLRDAVCGLMTDGKRQVVLNMAEVTRIDSRGIGCLARCQATAITRNADIFMVLIPGVVLDALTQLNFVKVCQVYPDEVAALAAASSKAAGASGP